MSLIENCPELELDKILYKTEKMAPHVRRERRIVWNLLKYLRTEGWNVIKVYDGDEYTKTTTPLAAMEVIFNLDDAQVGFVKSAVDGGQGKRHYVKLVLGNDIDVISDWNYSEGDPDGFSAAMDKFDAEAYA